MERGLILLFAALIVFMALGVRGTAHLSFANNTEVNITQDGCGATKLCVEMPDGCDPTGNSSCLFVSFTAGTPVASNGIELSIELRGDSEGYIALGLTENASQGNSMLFVCAQKNETFFFQTMDRNNTSGELAPANTNVTEIGGMVKNNVIKCEFNVPRVNASNSRTSHVSTFNVLLGRGSLNGSVLGPFDVSLASDPLNLANPASNVPSTAKPTTAGTVATTPASTVAMTPAGTVAMTPAGTVATTPAGTVATTPAGTVATTAASSAALYPYDVLLLLSVLTLSITLRP